MKLHGLQITVARDFSESGIFPHSLFTSSSFNMVAFFGARFSDVIGPTCIQIRT